MPIYICLNNAWQRQADQGVPSSLQYHTVLANSAGMPELRVCCSQGVLVVRALGGAVIEIYCYR